jgi:hypothetical protein
VNWLLAITGGDAESTTCTVKVNIPETVGVPPNTPLVLKLKPNGKFPWPATRLHM